MTALPIISIYRSAISISLNISPTWLGRKRKLQRPDIKRNMPQETVSNFGRPLVNMLLDNYHQDQITLSEVSGYLGLKVKHIPRLEQVAGFSERRWLR